ncbi:MAG: dihydroorotate dehydrogenase [Bacteroidales bacterium]|jgi:dihydroorotate dehydrogenase (NAD+) catalytic subunit|nr:dihydroorotate dehydrogenase [Bacteroidales bacterium]HOL97548.1 dihydroorotate dehydrogenase [Bacteroidales bacterium]HOM35816.1 dihydroorotate dehydrogenase [Bacteroidales bacterium]HPD22966.1 dihydroorotate dehydrogenase [Bacteroidales bacterium]HRS98806.1 dihydroorotate dehydrogenase [Bacteroidales bacterium]
MVNLEINFNGLKLKNPILTASGTFGYGYEFEDFVNLNNLGGFIVKGTTRHHREGNPYPRMAETPSGMLNAVGLQNKGVEYFCKNIYPKIKDYKTNVIVNVSGSIINDYVETAEMINELDNIPAIELNISCPNVKEGGMAFGTSCSSAAQVVKEVRKVYKKHLIVKLSPNVTDIVSIAKSVEAEGADSLSLVNTFLGMAIDIKTRKPKLSTITGGLSGPAIKPIAVRMVWQVSKAVQIPVCGLGGIMNYEDVIEFMLAGASCVQIGTANFINPDITMKIIHDLKVFCNQNNIKDINEIIGAMNC